MVIKHLNLLETSYFGLRFLQTPDKQTGGDKQPAKLTEWLDVQKSAIKQLRDVQPMTVYFGVKYYATDPCKLAEEITRYQFFLQCKQDILNGRLPVPFELAVELFALAIQSELGDFDPQRHQDGYPGEFQFVANQSEELERRAAMFHRQLTGQVPATAELNFLERVKWLDLYGCELHPIQYDDAQNNDHYSLGLNPTGVLVLRNKFKVASYLWSRIVKTKCQGRCFLMDVIDNNNSNSSDNKQRFGFRLIDKEASRRLRWAIEEYKGFYHLIHSTATLNQLAKRQQQQQLQEDMNMMKFSQRFRNSIRSAISIGHLSNQQLAQQQHQQHQQKLLRSSMKSLQNAAIHQQQQQQQHQLDSMRPPPTVVRMPSRRYSNRSLSRPTFLASQGQSTSQPYNLVVAANGNGLPAAAAGSQTMVESQRQQALMMMSQFNQQLQVAGKSQTLRPMASKSASKTDSKRNPYYQMMMMLAAQQHQQQVQQQKHLGHQPAPLLAPPQQPEVSVLAPGQHIVQPSIYKATSVINGINQLAPPASQNRHQATMMQQLFNTKPQYGSNHRPGHESPRSTKSAMAPSSAIKLASKKLAKQQQHFLYRNQADMKPLLQNSGYATDYSGHMQQAPIYSANPSPRSTRSARIGGKHRSKSTGENLHLLHQQQYNNNNRMLLLDTVANPMMPPPDYNLSLSRNNRPKQRQPATSDDDDDGLIATQSLISKRAAAVAQLNARKRATFALDANQANLLLNNNNNNLNNSLKIQRQKASDDDDDYYCSRSDCSSIDDGTGKNYHRSPRDRQARLINGQLINSQQQQRQPKTSRRISTTTGKENTNYAPDHTANNGGLVQKDWNAIKRRHNEYSSGKGLLGQLDAVNDHQQQRTTNNTSSNLIKNITNKRATPILLSMNYNDQLTLNNNNNNKAVQLLNLQRQQLHSQSSDVTSTPNATSASNAIIKTSGHGSTSTQMSTPSSSVASSPKTPNTHPANQEQQKQLASHHQQQHKSFQQLSQQSSAIDSTGSNSTTSGYYAGSNSTGPASVDSDTINNVDGGHKSPLNVITSPGSQINRAKVAMGSYATRTTNNGDRLVIGNLQNYHNLQQKQQQQQQGDQQFYLSDSNNNNNNNTDQSPVAKAANNNNNNNSQQQQQSWSPLEQMQQHAPSSLKYVSFDV